jgi:hypothetical protein
MMRVSQWCIALADMTAPSSMVYSSTALELMIFSICW